VRRIDRYASARLSAASGRDEFVVREHETEEAVRVIVVVDDSPTMELFPETLPWLHKPKAVTAASQMIARSARNARCRFDRGPEPSPGRGGGSREAALAALLGGRHGLPAGTFVFLVSDFLAAHPDNVWARAIERRWDLVPVIVQDSRWERSFPDVTGAVLPVADPVTGRVSLTRLSRAQVDRRRADNEARFSTLLARFARMGLDPVLVSSEGPRGIHAAFLCWADGRARDRTWLP
jgi:uncharacterized protein (DUF58 family)